MKLHTTTLSLLSTLALVPGCFQAGDDRMDPAPGMADTDGDAGTDDGNDDDGMDDGMDDGAPQAPEPAAGNALVRVIHGASDAPAVDIYAEGIEAPVLTDVSYGEATDYLEVPAGAYNFQIRPAGASALEPPVYETGALELADGVTVSALAAGLLAGEGDSAFRVIPLVEEWDGGLGGEALVRIVHAGADAPTVAIDVADDAEPEIEGLVRFADTGSAGVPLPAAESLQVGIRAGDQRVTAFTTPALPDGANVFVIATGRLGRPANEADGFALLAVGPEGSLGFIKQNPVVYALHASPDAPEVDLCAGDTLLANHLTFGNLARTQVPPGEYGIDFYASPSNCAGTAVTTDWTPELEAGEQYLAIATGEINPSVDEPPLQLVTFRNHFTPESPEDAIFNIVHAASAPEVDVGLVTGTTIEGGNLLQAALKWPSISETFAIQPFTYQIGLAAAGTVTPVASFHVDAYEGLRSFIVAAGDLSPETTEASLRLLSVDTSATPWTVDTYNPN